jgi:hypothetical protein
MVEETPLNYSLYCDLPTSLRRLTVEFSVNGDSNGGPACTRERNTLASNEKYASTPNLQGW